jgi:tyramine---L-glutamate ligase
MVRVVTPTGSPDNSLSGSRSDKRAPSLDLTALLRLRRPDKQVVRATLLDAFETLLLPHRRSILLYEFASSGGLLREQDARSGHLFAEGNAMLSALAEDFAGLDDTRVTLLSDYRLATSWPAGREIRPIGPDDDDVRYLAAAAARSDWTLIIAPETAGELERRASAVIAAGGRLLGPHPELISLAADKQRLCEHLANHGIPVPPGAIFRHGETLPHGIHLPAVVKPLDGCGAEGVRLVHDAASLSSYAQQREGFRIENYCPGVAASVAILGGVNDHRLLPACGQTIEQVENRLHYSGGYLPLEPSLTARAARLAETVADALTAWVGYLGIDLILGPAASGSDDVVIEVNPRLTTSYVGLRAAAGCNLAAAMLALAEGNTPTLEFSDARLRFAANGEIVRFGEECRLTEGAAP